MILLNKVIAREGVWFIIGTKLFLVAMGGWEGVGMVGSDSMEN